MDSFPHILVSLVFESARAISINEIAIFSVFKFFSEFFTASIHFSVLVIEIFILSVSVHSYFCSSKHCFTSNIDRVSKYLKLCLKLLYKLRGVLYTLFWFPRNLFVKSKLRTIHGFTHWGYSIKPSNSFSRWAWSFSHIIKPCW